MKTELTRLLAQSAAELCRQGAFGQDAQAPDPEQIHIEHTRNPKHGDFASNLALVLAQKYKIAPRDLAVQLIAALPICEWVAKIEIAGPGFLNFFIAAAAYYDGITEIRVAGEKYGNGDFGCGKKVLVEFVSANPTGPLHVGHGRGAAYGDAVARLLTAVGYEVQREYYVNDAGRQMDILALSVWLRYLGKCDASFKLQMDVANLFPKNGYRGDYVEELAAELHKQHGDVFSVENNADIGADTVLKKLFADLPSEEDKDEEKQKAIQEARIDTLIAKCKTILGENYYELVFNYGCDQLVALIKKDLRAFGVCFDTWFLERSLVENGDIQRAIATLKKNGHIYQKDGVTWFRASDFGDEKDRAVLRANGSHTYFASDIAYHFNKGERGFDIILNVFGADHHGYAGRVQASFEALGFASERLQVRLVQFAVLYRGRVKAPMSTRAGEFVTLQELREEVGNDAARFFYVSRKNDQHMDFDLELAKAQSADNPVYYIQYAHARIASVFRRLSTENIPSPDEVAPDYKLLVEAGELALMKTLLRFPEVVEQSAIGYEPHVLAYYLRALATDFHAYYNAHPFLSSEAKLRLARLGLIDATRQVLANGLRLLGVSAPEKM